MWAYSEDGGGDEGGEGCGEGGEGCEGGGDEDV